ncbi:MAG: glycosyltransferase family 4 protein [Deltaproteobacteria bacterium]|nr:MAG: glycosyltransferase family 4 protein [Deltaproteobacteria bacterium]
MRVLFLTIGPETEPSSRFRVYQYLGALRAAGVRARVRPLAGPRYVELGYGRLRAPAAVHAFWAALHFAARLARRLRDLWDARHFDVVFVQKEVFPFGMERLIGWLGLRVVYDFDDAIHVRSELREPRGRALARLADALLRRDRALPALLRQSAVVIAGNPVLAAYARHHNAAVHVVPTAIDSEAYAKRSASRGRRLRIGWFGAPATAVYLEPLRPALQELARRFDFELCVLGAERFDCPGVSVTCQPWRPYRALAEEASDLAGFDIGIMPLPDDAFAAGKCALKAIQYMACGIPVVASPVGAAREVVVHGENGFLADTAEAWTDGLGRLLADASLRERLGRAGRARVVERYSVQAVFPKLLAALREAAPRAYQPPRSTSEMHRNTSQPMTHTASARPVLE